MAESALRAETAIVTAVRSAPLRKRVAIRIGQALSVIFPGRARSVESGKHVGSTRLVDRMIRNGIRAHAIKQRDHRRIRDMHRAYWSSHANDFATDYTFRFREQFLASDASFLDNVDAIIKNLPIRSIVEVGCGNGLVLQYLSDRWPNVKQFVGIDIDAAVIQRNREVYKDPKFTFVKSDVQQWIRENATSSTLLITNGGVLEYFLKSEVEAMLDSLNAIKPAAVVFIETLGSDHDLERDCDTHVYGRELSFSHSYPSLLQQAGFKIHKQDERFGPHGDRWIRVAAVS